MAVIAKQLHHMMTRGLLDGRQTGPPLTITPPAQAAAAVGDLVPHVAGTDRVTIFPQASNL
jgi:hypothetical protein